MKKLKSKAAIAALTLSLCTPFAAVAGTWQSADNAWRYQNDDGSYVANAWLAENGSSYYFDSNGIMLKNTLSPDGYPLGQDGTWITDSETLPASFTGSKEEFTILFDEYMNFAKTFDQAFNNEYDTDYKLVLSDAPNGNYEQARAAVRRLEAYDFRPYLASGNMAVRKQAAASEIFRVEQICYLNELINGYQFDNYDSTGSALDKMLLSVDQYYNRCSGVLGQVSVWYNQFY